MPQARRNKHLRILFKSDGKVKRQVDGRVVLHQQQCRHYTTLLEVETWVES